MRQYLSVELLQLDLIKLLTHQFESHISILYHLLQILLGPQKRNQLFFIARLLESRYLFSDIGVDLRQILVFSIDEVFYCVSGLLQLELNLIHFLDL